MLDVHKALAMAVSAVGGAHKYAQAISCAEYSPMACEISDAQNDIYQAAYHCMSLDESYDHAMALNYARYAYQGALRALTASKLAPDDDDE